MLSKMIIRCFLRIGRIGLWQSTKFSWTRPHRFLSTLILSHSEEENIRLYALGNGTYGTPRSIYLVIDDDHRILFNCGEGTVKAVKERQLSMHRICSICITHRNWANLGGLPDVLYAVEKNSMQLLGPPNVERILVPMYKNNVFSSKVVIEKKEYNESHEDLEVGYSLTSIPLHQTHLTESSHTFTEDDDIALAYILKRNSIHPATVGPDNRIVSAQELRTDLWATLPDGEKFEAKDPVFPHRPLSVIVLECPHQDYLDSLLAAKGFLQYQMDSSSYIDAIIHLTPSSVMHHPKYTQWIQRFPAYTNHLIMNDSFEGCYERQMHKFQQFLNAFEPHLFPHLFKIEKHSHQEPETSNKMNFLPTKVLNIKPGKEGSRCEIQNSLSDSEGNREEEDKELSEWQEKKILLSSIKSDEAQYPEVIFLGTASKISSAIRSVPSILIHLSNDQCMLVDCGEGTYSQLINLYGKIEANRVLEKLVAVFISHTHADHRMGLETILFECQQISKHQKRKHRQIINIIAPKSVRNLLRDHTRTLEFSLLHCRFIRFADVTFGQGNDTRFLKDIPSVIQLNVVPVKHCLHAHGLLLVHCNGFKLVYSGDTAPCSELISAGLHCDLLIHEATYADDHRHLAKKTRHSTITEAINVSHQMKAKYTVLTHLGDSIYSKDSLLKTIHGRVAIAFDFLRITPQILHLLPLVTPIAFKVCFFKKFGQ